MSADSQWIDAHRASLRNRERTDLSASTLKAMGPLGPGRNQWVCAWDQLAAVTSASHYPPKRSFHSIPLRAVFHAALLIEFSGSGIQSRIPLAFSSHMPL